MAQDVLKFKSAFVSAWQQLDVLAGWVLISRVFRPKEKWPVTSVKVQETPGSTSCTISAANTDEASAVAFEGVASRQRWLGESSSAEAETLRKVSKQARLCRGRFCEVERHRCGLAQFVVEELLDCFQRNMLMGPEKSPEKSHGQ